MVACGYLEKEVSTRCERLFWHDGELGLNRNP